MIILPELFDQGLQLLQVTVADEIMGIYRELQAQGYQGSYENVRVQFADPSQKAGTKRGARSLPPEALPSSRQASWSSALLTRISQRKRRREALQEGELERKKH